MKPLAPRHALLLSVLAAIVTIALKATAWLLTGSVGFLSDALESGVNLAGALFALLMVIYAARPADRGHPFGHGKAEYFSSGFEGLLIALAAMSIFIAAGQRLFDPQPLAGLGYGSAFVMAATVVNLLVARVLLHSGRSHRSPATEADGKHLMADVWTSIGVVAGVGLAWLSGWYWLDPLVAIAVALNILREGWVLVRRSFDGLMDGALATSEIAQIQATLERLCPAQGQLHGLRTRSAGRHRFAYVELRVPPQWPVERATEAVAVLERGLTRQGITLTVHLGTTAP